MRVAAFDVADDLPELREPCALAMLTPWVNVGKVGRLVLGKVERHLGAKELGRPVPANSSTSPATGP